MDIREIQLRQMTNQYLLSPGEKIQVVRELCGIQCQFMVNAMHSLKIRCKDFDEATVGEGLVKNWTLRGTVHVFANEDLPLFVRCDNATRYRNEEFYGFTTWLRPDGSDIWYNEGGVCTQVYALTPQRERFFLHVILDALKDGSKTREELKELCREAGMTDMEKDAMFNAWGGAIGTFCHRGFLNHVVQEKKAFCLAPQYTPMTDEEGWLEIARRYFTYLGPATVHDAMYFLGAKQYQVKSWMEKLPLLSAEAGGKTYYYIENGRSYHGEIPRCLFLAGFDQLMLAYQKKESLYLRSEHLRKIFNLAGIVMPSVLLNGRVVGKWKKKNKKLSIELFESLTQEDKQIIKDKADSLWQDLKTLEMT